MLCESVDLLSDFRTKNTDSLNNPESLQAVENQQNNPTASPEDTSASGDPLDEHHQQQSSDLNEDPVTVAPTCDYLFSECALPEYNDKLLLLTILVSFFGVFCAASVFDIISVC